MVALGIVMSALGASAGDEVEPTRGQTVTPAQEERAVEHWNKYINEPRAGDPSPEDARDRALQIPGDEHDESDVDRLEGFE
jgi:hypothetical protein